jgi:hypothetical protein
LEVVTIGKLALRGEQISVEEAKVNGKVHQNAKKLKKITYGSIWDLGLSFFIVKNVLT